MKHLLLFENFSRYKYEVMYNELDSTGDPIEIYEFDNLDDALNQYSKYEYGENKNKTHQKMIFKSILNKDGDTLYSIPIQSDTYRYNDKSDNILDDIEEWFKDKYDSRNYKYHTIEINGITIQVRFSDHTENIMNNDRYDLCDYYISIIIADHDVTKNRFGIQNNFERRNNEIELKFDSDDDFNHITNTIEETIHNIV